VTERPLVELRLRSRIPAEELEEKIGKVLTPEDFNLVPTGDVKILKPDGKLLCIYRRGIIPPELREAAWPILHSLKNATTTNRGLAGGTPRVQGPGSRSYGKAVPSALLGAFEPQGPRKFCRLTAWTGRETEKFKILWPLLQFIGQRMELDAPARYQAQMNEILKTSPDWVIPGTPFSTVTVNNTYPTGVHQDAGDLDAGISTLAVFREGDYRGGVLVFPEYRVGVEMQDSDLLLMDAHSFHGNTDFDPPVKRSMTGKVEEDPGFERISVVSYYRTRLTTCESANTEAGTARRASRRRRRRRVARSPAAPRCRRFTRRSAGNTSDRGR
jgi:hypothetical protein